MINSVTSNALHGYQRSQRTMSQAANNIASTRVTPVSSPQATSQSVNRDMTRSLVELNQSKTEALASVRVLKTADETLGTLLDVKA